MSIIGEVGVMAEKTSQPNRLVESRKNQNAYRGGRGRVCEGLKV
jgi:hypothetical protein